MIWRVPEPVPPSEHPFKYRLVYIVGGKRVVGYDNERGKGDHKHLAGHEEPYHFTDVDKLFVHTVFVDQGPTLRRFMTRAQGRATRVNKKTSHVTLVLADRK